MKSYQDIDIAAESAWNQLAQALCSHLYGQDRRAWGKPAGERDRRDREWKQWVKP